jgi:hypothetical protein
MTDLQQLRAAADKATAAYERAKKAGNADKVNAAWRKMADARHDYRAAVRVIEDARLERIAAGTWL